MQENAVTVAGVLRGALQSAGVEVGELVGAGRTDAGVHALHQVAHLRLRAEVDPEQLRRALNDELPHDVNVMRLQPAGKGWHARHDAVERSYLYQISRRRTALHKRFVWWVRDGLDVGALREAAAAFVGHHDFQHYCVAPAQQDNTLVEVAGIEVGEHEDLLVLRFRASHFLWRMVRRLVGSLVEVGAGRLDAAQLVRWLEGEPPRPEADPARFTAAPSGLFLERVRYPGDPPLDRAQPLVRVASLLSA